MGRTLIQLLSRRQASALSTIRRTAASMAVPPHETASTIKMNLFTAINDAMSIALRTDDSAIVFGEDVAFGGVFRCSQNLRQEFGHDRVFNTPLSENGIAGFAIGYAATGGTAIGEIQFADYVRPGWTVHSQYASSILRVSLTTASLCLTLFSTDLSSL